MSVKKHVQSLNRTIVNLCYNLEFYNNPIRFETKLRQGSAQGLHSSHQTSKIVQKKRKPEWMDNFVSPSITCFLGNLRVTKNNKQ